jgi:hypothetical protein
MSLPDISTPRSSPRSNLSWQATQYSVQGTASRRLSPIQAPQARHSPKLHLECGPERLQPAATSDDGRAIDSTIGDIQCGFLDQFAPSRVT